MNVVTTKDRRGDFIDLICQHFGYNTVHLPDNSEKGGYLFKLRKVINKEERANLAIASDGPLGPYHKPKYFRYQ